MKTSTGKRQMINTFASILRRAPGAVIADMAGVVALTVLVFGALNLPGGF